MDYVEHGVLHACYRRTCFQSWIGGSDRRRRKEASGMTAMLPASRDDAMCACEGCERPKAKKHPLCHGHAKRYQKHGVTGGPLRKRGKSGIPRFGPNGGDCPIEGCMRRAKSLGLCKEHYQSIVRCGSIVEDGRIVSRRISFDRLKYGEAWLKWSARASGHLSRIRRNVGRDEWDKWAVAKKSNMRSPRYQGRSNRQPAACNATWDTKVQSMNKAIFNTAMKSHWNKWDRWASTKAIRIYGRRSRNSQAN